MKEYVWEVAKVRITDNGLTTWIAFYPIYFGKNPPQREYVEVSGSDFGYWKSFEGKFFKIEMKAGCLSAIKKQLEESNFPYTKLSWKRIMKGKKA